MREQPTSPQKWVTFTHFSPTVRKITNIFKRTDIGISLEPQTPSLKNCPWKDALTKTTAAFTK